MSYGCQICGQSDNKSFNKIKILQNNALRPYFLLICHNRCQIWVQSDNKSFNKIKILQNNALRLDYIIFFLSSSVNYNILHT